MEDISKYLDNLFAQLPNTPEARHAREELGQMMEDRYAELCAKGMGEKDAASAAIAEFGSLEEVRESLGLGADAALFSLHASLSWQSPSRSSRGTESPPASAARLGMAHPSARARRRARRAR